MSFMSALKNPRPDSPPLPEFMLSRDGKLKGEVIGSRRCQLEGCTGLSYIVRWPDGKRTHPCSKGCKETDTPGTRQIES
jgi:hypothetical protein